VLVFDPPRHERCEAVSAWRGAFSPAECDALWHLRAEPARQRIVTTSDGSGGVAGVETVAPLGTGSDATWVWERLAGLVRTANTEDHHFDLLGILERPLLVEHQVGAGHGWRLDLGPGIQSGRKLTVVVELSDPAEHRGGRLRLNGPYGARHDLPHGQGDVVVFPTWTVTAVEPVTAGRRRSLLAWAAGPPLR
jgi:PKHD-type hydroxylase